jgi:diacylglycerol kinase (ATP)
MRVRIIANPKSGRGRGLSAAATAAAVLQDAGWQVEVIPTTTQDDATRLAREVADCDLVVACGGDGTLSEVINGLRDTGVPVGFIPAGTGNDFALTVGLSRDPAEAARQLLAGQPRPVDLMAVGDGDRVAINVIGVGFDAAVAARMNRSTRLAGRTFAYLGAIVMELARLPRARVTLRIDGQEWRGEALLIALANAQSYGAGMRIAPQACIDDGLMDVVLVQPMGRLEFLRNLRRVFRGTHVELPQVICWQAREVTVAGEAPLPVMVDGDLRAQTPLHVRLLPGAVKLWLPSS